MKEQWLRRTLGAPARTWLETFLLTALALGGGYWLDPTDPFLTQADFPWIWFAPAMLALRYGVLSGILSSLVLVLSWVLAQEVGLFPITEFPKLFFLGGLVLTMLCGEYCDLWHNRLERVEQQDAYTNDRLERLTRMYFLLRLSHDRLEQNLIAKPLTLRSILARMRRMSLSSEEELSPPVAKKLLQLLSQYCQLEVAAFYRAGEGGSEYAPVATVGRAGKLWKDDPLLQHAIAEGTLCHIAAQEFKKSPSSRYLVVAPMQTGEGQIIAWLAVEKMAFLALHEDTLRMLLVFLSYFADSAYVTRAAKQVFTACPDCPPLFAHEFLKLMRLQREFGIRSSIVSLAFKPHAIQGDLVSQVRKIQRGLDVIWEYTWGLDRMVILLMPFSNEAAVEGYLIRFADWVKECFGLSLEEAHITTQFTTLDGDDPIELLGSVWAVRVPWLTRRHSG